MQNNVENTEQILVPTFKIADRPPTKEEIDRNGKVKEMLLKNTEEDWKKRCEEKVAEVIEMLKNTKNDPNTVFTTAHHFIFGDK